MEGCSERLRTQMVPSQVHHLGIYTGLRCPMAGYADLRACLNAGVPRMKYPRLLLFLLLPALSPLSP
jgi:hypothetical protein